MRTRAVWRRSSRPPPQLSKPALSKNRPRHSILFVTLFGAELGGLGAAYLSQHPLVPIEKSMGCINLSHLGRTDVAGGTRTRALTITGFPGSKVPAIFESAGKQSGICVQQDTNNKILSDRRGFKPFLYYRRPA